MNLASCLYVGQVRHRRSSFVVREFRYRLFMVYLDLDELPEVFRGRLLWSVERPNVAWFRRADHLGSPERPLAECVRDLVEQRLGRRPRGPIRLLTHLRYFGLAMNPVSFYYCFEGGESPTVVVAEVTNTPWNERHWYVLDLGGAARLEADKQLHVSPFLPMHYRYRFEFAGPGEELRVRIENRATQVRRRGDVAVTDVDFEAELRLARRSLTGANLAAMLVRFPWMTLRVYLAIYGQALRLLLRRVPFVPHPRSRSAPPVEPSIDRTTPESQEVPA